MYDYLTFTSGSYLAHHGVQGMHWGIRRYQNPDGSYTDLGRRHYGLTDRRVERTGKKLKAAGIKTAEAYDQPINTPKDLKRFARTQRKAEKAMVNHLNALDRLKVENEETFRELVGSSKRLNTKLQKLERKQQAHPGRYDKRIEKVKGKSAKVNSDGWRRLGAATSQHQKINKIINAAKMGGYNITSKPTYRIVRTPGTTKASVGVNLASMGAIMAARAAGAPATGVFMHPYYVAKGTKYKLSNGTKVKKIKANRRNQNG